MTGEPTALNDKTEKSLGYIRESFVTREQAEAMKTRDIEIKRQDLIARIKASPLMDHKQSQFIDEVNSALTGLMGDSPGKATIIVNLEREIERQLREIEAEKAKALLVRTIAIEDQKQAAAIQQAIAKPQQNILFTALPFVHHEAAIGHETSARSVSFEDGHGPSAKLRTSLGAIAAKEWKGISHAAKSKWDKLMDNPGAAMEEAAQDVDTTVKHMGGGAEAMWKDNRVEARKNARTITLGVRNVTGSEIIAKGFSGGLNAGATAAEKAHTTADLANRAKDALMQGDWNKLGDTGSVTVDAISRNVMGAMDGATSLFGLNDLDNATKAAREKLMTDRTIDWEHLVATKGKSIGQNIFDIDGNENISKTELATVLRNNGFDLAKLDRNHDKTVDYTELTNALKEIAIKNGARVELSAAQQQAKQAAEIAAARKAAGLDGDDTRQEALGKINKFLKDHGVTLAQADKDHNGAIGDLELAAVNKLPLLKPAAAAHGPAATPPRKQ